MKTSRSFPFFVVLGLLLVARPQLAAWTYSSPADGTNMQVTVSGSFNLSALAPGSSLPLTVHCTDEGGQWWRIDWVWLNGNAIATYPGTNDWWGWPSLTVPATPGNYSFTVACQDGRGIYRQQVVNYSVSNYTTTVVLTPAVTTTFVGQTVNMTIAASCGAGVERLGCAEYDANGNAISYTWDFPGTGTNSSRVVSFTSTALGRRYFRPYVWVAGYAQIVQGNMVSIATVPPNPPTVSWPVEPPAPLYAGTAFPVRARGSDLDGNLGGIWVEYSTDAGANWIGLAYDLVGVNGGDGGATTSNSNTITAGPPGSTYRFRAYAYDQAGLNSGWQVHPTVFTVTNRQPGVALAAVGQGSVNGGSQIDVSVPNGTTLNFTSTASDPDGNFARIRTWVNYNNQGWVVVRDDASASCNWSYALSGIGTYQFHSRSMDAANAESATAIINVTATNRAPTISLAASPTTISFGQTTAIASVATDPDGNLAFHGILTLNQARNGWFRSPRTDHSTGWGNHPASNDFLSENYTSGVASGGSNTRTIVHRPSWAGLVSYHSNASDGSLWESSWYPVMYADVTVNRATPNGTFAPRSFPTTCTLAVGDLNAAFTNPYSGAVVAPTGTVSYNYAVGTTLYPGTYYVVATYPGDGNYLGTTASATFTIANSAPTAAMSIKGLSSGTTTAAIGEVLSITLSGADPDGNLRAVNLWVLTPNYGWRNIRADSTVAGGYAENATVDNAVNTGANVSALGTVTRSFTIAPGQGVGTYSFVVRSMDASGQSSVSQQVNVAVGKANPSVTWAAPTPTVYGSALSSTQLNATASVPGTFVYTPASGSVLAAGAQSLSVTFTPTDTVNYNAVTQTVSLVVNKAPLTITAKNESRIFGAGNPTFTASYGGLVNGDTSSVVTGLSIACPATTTTPVGTYPTVTPSGASAANYAIGYVAGVLTITAQPVSFTFSNTNPVYDGTAKAPVIINPSGSTYSVAGTTSATNAGSYSFTVTANGNYSGATTCNWSIAPQPVTFTFTQIDFIYNGSVRGPTVSPANVGNEYTQAAPSLPATTFATTATMKGAYSFRVTATGNYTGWGDCYWSITCCDATVALGSLNQTYTGTPRAATATTSPAGHNVVFTYTDGATVSTNPPTNVGSYPVTGAVSEPPDSNGISFSGHSDGVLVIAAAPATVTLSGLNQAYTGSPRPVTATTSPTGLAVAITYAGSPTAPTAVGDYAVSCTISNPNYVGSASGTLHITKADQAPLMIVPPVSPQAYAATQTLQATGGSGTGAVTFRQVTQDPATGVLATLSGTSNALLTTLASAGSVDIQAVRAGDENYNPAASNIVRVVLTKANPVIVWPTPGGITYGTPLSATQLNATANVPGAFVHTPASGSVLGAGTQSLSATFTPTDTANYNTITQSVTLAVAKATPAVTWPTPGGIVYGTALSATQLNATASVPGSFAYTPAIGAVLGAAPQILSVTFTPTDAANYNSMPMSVTLVVAKATPTTAWATPAGIVYGTALSATQLNAAAGVPGAFTYTPASGTVLAAGTQNLSAVFTPTDPTNYNSVPLSVTLAVAKANPVLTWPTPAGITFGTALGAAQLNATGNVPGSFTYSPPGGAVLAAGIRTLSATFAPTDSTNYNLATKSVTLAVSKATPAITWPAPAGIVYGTALSATQLNATTPVPGAFSYSPALGAVLSAGIQALSATFTPYDTANYNSVMPTVNLTIAKATPVVTWPTPAGITFGTALSATQLNATASVPGAFVYTPTLGATLPAGTQTLSVTFTPTDTGNFNNVTQTVSLPVAKAIPTITWLAPAAIVYGASLSGAQLNATASVPGSFVYLPAAGAVLHTGTRTLDATFTPTDASNYSSVSPTSSIVVNRAPLAVIAGNATRIYGAANPIFTATYSGFVNNDTAAVVSLGATGPVLSTEATPASPVGIYDILPALGTLSTADYVFTTFTAGKLTITRAPLTVTADNVSRLYGDANPTFTATITGFVNGENVGVLNGTSPALAVAATATATATAGSTHTITAAEGNLAAANYSFFYGNGTLTIAKAHLDIVPDNKERFYGQQNPPLTASYAGFKNDETVSVLGGTNTNPGPTLYTSAMETSPIQVYAITVVNRGSLSAANYDFPAASFKTGELKVKSPNDISFPQPPDRLVGDTFVPVASSTAGEGFPVSFEIAGGPATYNGTSVKVTGIGHVTIRAMQPGNGTTMPAAASVVRSFEVYSPDADQDGDGIANKDERIAMLSYDSRTSTMGQKIPKGWPNTASTANTTPVGMTAGNLSVDKFGALTYSVPIWVSPGTAGMQPQLALNYSSQAGPGIAGFGWSLSGVSAISRGPQTRATDNNIHGVDFTAADRFYLDGQRLIRVGGAVYGANNGNTEYRTEIDSFSKIVSSGVAGSGPAKFKVWTKAGLTIEFGSTADSAAEAQGRTEIATWAVSKISDTVGNAMEFTYLENEGEQLLSRIDYTKHETAPVKSAYASVRFVYGARSDVFRGYAAGSKIARTQRLNSIAAYYGETAVRTYTLNYTQRTTANARTLLTSLTETDADANSYPDLVFEYEPPVGGWEPQTAMATPFPMAVANIVTGAGLMDLDGDSYVDFVRKKMDNSQVPSSNDADLSDGKVTAWSDTVGYHLPGPFTLSWDGRSDAGARFVDFDGDGLQDILFSCRIGPNNIVSAAARNTGSGWDDVSATAAIPTAQTYISGFDRADSGRRFLDVNGDGLSDLVWHIDDGSQDKGCLINNSHGQFQSGGSYWVRDDRWAPPFPLMANVSSGAQFLDVNGDGLPDLIQYGRIGGTLEAGVALNSATGWGTNWSTAIAADNATMATIKAQLGALGKYLPPALMSKDATGWSSTPIGSEVVDLNGDGLPDILMRNPQLESNLGSARAFLNTGDGWVASSAYTPPSDVALSGRVGGNDTDGTGAVVADINGDGLPDLAVSRSDQGSNRVYYLNTGQGWGTANTSYLEGSPDLKLPHPIVHGSLATPTGTQLADLNGDGIVDSFTTFNGTDGTRPSFNKARPTADRLTKVTNGFGVAATVAYARLNERDSAGNPLVYTKGSPGSSAPIYPVVDLTGPMVVVKSVSNDDGAGGHHTVSYSYQGLRAHALYGSLGFESMTVSDDRTGIVGVTRFRQDYPFAGMPSSSLTTAPNPNGGDPVTLSLTSTSYLEKSLNSGATRFLYASAVTAKSWDLNGDLVAQSTTTTNDYDDYGNALTVAVDTSDGYSKTTANRYKTVDTTKWFLGRLDRSTVTSVAPAKPTLKRISEFDYDSLTGLLNKEIVEPDDATAAQNLKLTTTYDYDEFGNKKKATVTGRDGTGTTDVSRITTTLYDSRGRFPHDSTNAAGHTEIYGYDEPRGVLTSLTGPNNLTTDWGYDGFGAKTSETRLVGRSDSTVTEIRTKWAGTGAPSAAKYFVESESSGSPPSMTYYDAYGRAFRSLGITGGGEIVYSDTTYDNLSRGTAKSVPYRNDGSPIYWAKTTSYDVLNRPLTSVTPDDQTSGGEVTTSFSYEGLAGKVTVSLPNGTDRVSRSVKNNQGQLVESTRDFGGTSASTVTYGYDALGSLTSTVAAGVTTSLSYDVRGRKIGMIDADMGTWSYGYNAFGELISQSDAKSQTTTLSYDSLGRLATRGEAEGTTTWTYDSATNGKGKLALVSVSAPSLYSESYTYDSAGRPTGITRNIDSTAYSIGQTYDSYGRPEKMVYPGTAPLQVKNVYGSFGAVKQVRRTDSTNADLDLYWQADRYAVDGRVDGETYGNLLTGDRVYSPATGRLLTATVGVAPANGIQHLNYTYDEVGNVVSRQDQATGRDERFDFADGSSGYDGLDRLRVHRVIGGATVTVSYDAKGNITNKSDVGGYTYNCTPVGRTNVLPHAVSAAGGNSYDYDKNGNMTGGAGRTITWTSFNQAKRIQNTANTIFSEFSFGAGHERVKQLAHNGTTIYVGGTWEKFTNTGGGVVMKNYIMAPTGRVAVVTYGNGIPVEGTVNYFHTDGLGSITVVTDATGNVLNRFVYDAWGKRAVSGTIFTRGYTDHEHLEDLGLIHMNGRIYDPVLGRFLSADPNVDGVYDSQDYNRYSYVGNNPMNATDPSGYFSLKDAVKIVAIVVAAWVTAGAALYAYAAATGATFVGGFAGALASVGTAAGWSGGWAIAAGVGAGFGSGFASSLLNGGSIGDAFKAGVIGGIVGGISAGIAGKIGNAFGGYGEYGTAGEFGRGLAHGVSQGALTEAQGGEFRHGFYAGFSSSVAAGPIGSMMPDSMTGRTVAAAVVGGTASALGGGKFANGAISGAFTHLFNDEAHSLGGEAEDRRLWWEKFGDGYYYGTGYGEDAVQFYANVTLDPNVSWYAKTGAYVGGTMSALWTRETYQETAWTLVTAGAETAAARRITGTFKNWKFQIGADKGWIRFSEGFNHTIGTKNFRLAFGGKSSWIHGHINGSNLFKPSQWFQKIGKWTNY